MKHTMYPGWQKKEVFLMILLQAMKMPGVVWLESITTGKDQPQTDLARADFYHLFFLFSCMSSSKSYLLCLKGYPVLAFLLIIHIFKVWKPFLWFWSAHFQEKLQANVLQCSVYWRSHLHLKLPIAPKSFLSIIYIFTFISEVTTFLYQWPK